MAVLFSTTRGVSCREKKNRVFHTSKMFIHSNFPLEKCITRSQTVTRSGEEVTYGFPRGIKSSEQAELAYPPKSMVLSRLKGGAESPKLQAYSQ